MFDLPHPAPTRDTMRDIEIRVLTDVIESAETLLRQLEATGSRLIAPRPAAYATIIHAVVASARASGHYGQGSLAHAPLLDAILSGADATPWDTAIFAVLMHSIVLD